MQEESIRRIFRQNKQPRYTGHFEQRFFLKASVIFLLHLVKGSQSKNTSIERFRKWIHMAVTALEICDREKIY